MKNWRFERCPQWYEIRTTASNLLYWPCKLLVWPMYTVEYTYISSISLNFLGGRPFMNKVYALNKVISHFSVNVPQRPLSNSIPKTSQNSAETWRNNNLQIWRAFLIGTPACNLGPLSGRCPMVQWYTEGWVRKRMGLNICPYPGSSWRDEVSRDKGPWSRPLMDLRHLRQRYL